MLVWKTVYKYISLSNLKDVNHYLSIYYTDTPTSVVEEVLTSLT